MSKFVYKYYLIFITICFMLVFIFIAQSIIEYYLLGINNSYMIYWIVNLIAINFYEYLNTVQIISIFLTFILFYQLESFPLKNNQINGSQVMRDFVIMIAPVLLVFSLAYYLFLPNLYKDKQQILSISASYKENINIIHENLKQYDYYSKLYKDSFNLKLNEQEVFEEEVKKNMYIDYQHYYIKEVINAYDRILNLIYDKKLLFDKTLALNISEKIPKRNENIQDLSTFHFFDKSPEEIYNYALSVRNNLGDLYTSNYLAYIGMQATDLNSLIYNNLYNLYKSTELEIKSKIINYEEEQVKLNFLKKKLAGNFYDNENYYAAYYIFLDINNNNKADREAKRYLANSYNFLKEKYFFAEDFERVRGYDGVDLALFLNINTPTTKEFIKARKLIKLKEGVFAYDIEVINMSFINNKFEVNYHLKAPYAVLEKEKINFNIMNKEFNDDNLLLQYLVINNSKLPIKDNYYPLNITTEYAYLGSYFNEYKVINLMDLLKMYNEIDLLGFNKNKLIIEIIYRFSFPFLFICISFFALALSFKLFQKNFFEGNIIVPFIVFIGSIFVIVNVMQFIEYIYKGFIVLSLFLFSHFHIFLALLSIILFSLFFILISIWYSLKNIKQHNRYLLQRGQID